MGIFKSKKKILVIANNYSTSLFWRINSVESRFGYSAFYLCNFLNFKFNFNEFYKRIFKFFTSPEKVLVNSNFINSINLWRINCLNSRLSRSSTYIYNFLTKSILGISAFFHDSAATILIDGKIIAAAQEERFSRKKHDAGYPHNAIEFVLNYANLKLNDVDQIVFEKPFLKFERLLETYVAFAPKGFRQFCKAMPVWLRDKLFQKRCFLIN